MVEKVDHRFHQLHRLVWKSRFAVRDRAVRDPKLGFVLSAKTHLFDPPWPYLPDDRENRTGDHAIEPRTRPNTGPTHLSTPPNRMGRGRAPLAHLWRTSALYMSNDVTNRLYLAYRSPRRGQQGQP